jgi:hypothetical protein
MQTLLTNPFAAACLAAVAVFLIALLAVPRLLGLFKTNSFTGRVKSLNRDWINGVVTLSVESLAGSGTRTFQAWDPLGEELERVLLTYRRTQQRVLITVVYDPSDGISIMSYSIITQP